MEETRVKVLHVVTQLNRGGLETFVFNLIKNNTFNYDMNVVVQGEAVASYEPEFLKYNVNIHRVSKFKNPLAYLLDINKLVRKEKFDIVHIHSYNTALFPIIACKINSVKVIAHSHNTSSSKGLVKSMKNILRLPIRYLADERLACGEGAGRWLFGNKSFKVINNGVGVDEFSFNEDNRIFYQTQLHIDKKEIACISVGRLEEVKNHSFLIDVFSKIVKENDKYKLFVVGNGSLENQLKEKVNKLNLQNNVIFLGIRTDVSSILSAMDIMLMPSLYEGFPVVIVEAQVNGIPIICSNNISSETNLGVSKMIFEELNENKWGENIKQIDENSRKDLYYEILKAYDIKYVVNRINDIYLSLLK